jgi:alanine dehydrogenase
MREFVNSGHEVQIEESSRLGSSIPNEEFVAAGARILEEVDDVWAESDYVLKVKEPVEEEFSRMHGAQELFNLDLRTTSTHPLGGPARSSVRPYCRRK